MTLPDEFLALRDQVNNWGRWGDDDERGTLNLIDGAAVLRGRDAIVTGAAIPLAVPVSKDGIQAGLVEGRENPHHRVTHLHRPMLEGAPFDMSDSVIEIGLNAATHWDALAHVSYDGRMYNGGTPADVTLDGAGRNGIDAIGAIVTRGVLLDVPRSRGEDWLAPGFHVTAEVLDACVDHAGVELQPGDIVLVRTGQMRFFHRGERIQYAFPAPGLTMDVAPWNHRHQVAAMAIDTLAFDAFPGAPPELLFPLHALHLVEMGLTQGQNWDLEALAEACASDGRHTFLLSATPEPVVGGLGGPVAPVAVR